jgi:hypothetical protein
MTVFLTTGLWLDAISQSSRQKMASCCFSGVRANFRDSTLCCFFIAKRNIFRLLSAVGKSDDSASMSEAREDVQDHASRQGTY